MDLTGWIYGLSCASAVALVLVLAGGLTRWRRRDLLRGPTAVPDDLVPRFLTRSAITVGLVLLTLVVAATYYGSHGGASSVMGVSDGPLVRAVVASIWAVALWQVARGRLAPYPGGWSGVTTCAILWLFPVGPFAMAWLATLLGGPVDWDHAPGRGVLPVLALTLVYVAVPVTAFRLRNRQRAGRSVAAPRLEATPTASI